MKKILGIILCSVFLLTGCDYDTNNSNKIQTYKSYNDKFSVDVKQGWEAVEKGNLNDSADIELADESNDKYFMALLESKKDFEWNYNEYADFMFKTTSNMYKVELGEPQEIEINGYKCKYVEFKTTLEEPAINSFMQVYIIETKNYYGQLFTWTLNSKKDEYREEFIEIAKSFKEL